MEKEQTEKSKQTTESTMDEETSTPDKSTEPESTIETLIQQRFRELRHEYLDDRATSINCWLGIIGIILAFFGFIIPIMAIIVGSFAYERFENLESQAKEYLEKIKGYEKTAEEVSSKFTSEDVDRPETVETVRETVQEVQQNPDSSFEEKIWAEALSLQDLGRIAEAIEKWRSLASVAEGIDNDLAAHSWFSVGYLYHKQDELEKALFAYDKSTDLKPDLAEAYVNRGVVKANRNEYAAALKDYNNAIRLKPDYANAYYNRGVVKEAQKDHASAFKDFNRAIQLKPDLAEAYANRGNTKVARNEYAAALEDYDNAIRLKPDLAKAYYNRGIAKLHIDNIESAKVDFQIALELAKQQGNDDLKIQIEQRIQELDSTE